MNLNLWEDGEILFDTEQMEGYCEVGSYVLRHDERARKQRAKFYAVMSRSRLTLLISVEH